MANLLITLACTLMGLVIGFLEWNPWLYGLLGFLLGRVLALDLSVRGLRREIDRLARPQPHRPVPRQTMAMPAPATVPDLPITPPDEDSEDLSLEVEETPPRPVPPKAPASAGPDPWGAIQTPAWLTSLMRWFVSGNLFVRIGILLVFFGVSFLIKYAVDQQWLHLTLSMRLTGIAVAALIVLALGWRLRRSRPDYGLLLQGAACGVLYLDVYGAYQLAGLLDAGPAFALLAIIAVLSASLAVVQNTSSLAWFGFSGGFLAPLLASTGAESAAPLFGYYALLNAAILAVAWFRSWRALNLLGFAFTFAIASAWGVLEYRPEHFASTEPFLILFFLFYVAITVLYARRQPLRLRGAIDATLLFGTPLLTFACQSRLVGEFPRGEAVSALVLGLFYLALSWLTGRFAGPGCGLLARAFRVLGIIFLTLTIPFWFTAGTTSGLWALEGMGLVWIGTRQHRPATRISGLLLQVAAAVALAATFPLTHDTPFLNPTFPAALALGIAAICSAFWLDQSRDRTHLPPAGLVLSWGILWWFSAALLELLRANSPLPVQNGLLGFGIITAVLWKTAELRWRWEPGRRVLAALPLIGVMAAMFALTDGAHPGTSHGLWAWGLFIATMYLLLKLLERPGTHTELAWAHAGLALLAILIAQWELLWTVFLHVEWDEAWKASATALVPGVALNLILFARIWPFRDWRFVYETVVGGTLALLLVFWMLAVIPVPGGLQSWPWMPLLNPIGAMTALVLATLWVFLRRSSRDDRLQPPLELVMNAGLGILTILAITLMLVRTLHHWAHVTYTLQALHDSGLTQMSLAILWSTLGVLMLLFARWRQSRPWWFGATSLLAIVVIKLFAIDLAASGTLERIVSFLAVGGLLVGIGWLAPLPRHRHADNSVRTTAGPSETGQ